MTNDKELPQSLEMEQAVLGSMLIDPSTIPHVAKVLQAGDFYRPAHGLIYDAIRAIDASGDPVDALTVQDVLKIRNQLEKCNGIGYLFQLAEAAQIPAHAPAYAMVVREKSICRGLIAFANSCQRAAYSDFADLGTMLAEQERELLKISRGVRGPESAEVRHIAEFRAEFMDRIEAASENGGKVPGVRSGLSDVDYMLGAMEKGQMTVLGANSSTGKTAMAMNIADYAASDGKRVVIFSLEMTGAQIYRRLVSSSGHIHMQKLRSGQMDAADWQRVGKQADIIASRPLYVCEGGAETVGSMGAKLRAIHAENPVDLFIVDYLQLMPTEKQTPQEVGMNAKGLKAIAKEMGTHCLCLSQLSRAAGKDKPQMSHLRESGEIEHTADSILLLWATGNTGDLDDVVEVGVHCAKSRDGATGETQLWFDKKCTRFFDTVK